jgi:hypothetical protein
MQSRKYIFDEDNYQEISEIYETPLKGISTNILSRKKSNLSTSGIEYNISTDNYRHRY